MFRLRVFATALTTIYRAWRRYRDLERAERLLARASALMARHADHGFLAAETSPRSQPDPFAPSPQAKLIFGRTPMEGAFKGFLAGLAIVGSVVVLGRCLAEAMTLLVGR